MRNSFLSYAMTMVVASDDLITVAGVSAGVVSIKRLLYCIVVTEREVRRGIINAKDTQKHCLAYIRNIENINVSSVKFARNFIDMIGRDVDEEAESLLSILRDELLPTRLADSNIVHFTVEWSREVGLDVDTHRDYLRQFCEIFYRLVN